MSDSDVRVQLDLAYLGTHFSGWARQPDKRTVQGVLEAGIERLVRREARGLSPVVLTVAGRTDAGVHARGQVAHIDLDAASWESLPGRSSRSPETALVDRLSSVLDHDVVVRHATRVPPGFDARFSALSRTYRYRISDTMAGRDPLRSAWTHWHKRSLDERAMAQAAASILGLRDFAAFCRPREGATTIRELQRFNWERPTGGPDEGLVVAEITSDAFCHNMVRALVGTCLLIGEGKHDPQWLGQVLESRDRSQAGVVVEPRGLTLESVAYPPAGQLASRADAVRAKRIDEEVLG